jgi:hypothetical protein
MPYLEVFKIRPGETRTLTIEWGGTTDPDNLIVVPVPSASLFCAYRVTRSMSPAPEVAV